MRPCTAPALRARAMRRSDDQGRTGGASGMVGPEYGFQMRLFNNVFIRLAQPFPDFPPDRRCPGSSMIETWARALCVDDLRNRKGDFPSSSATTVAGSWRSLCRDGRDPAIASMPGWLLLFEIMAYYRVRNNGNTASHFALKSLSEVRCCVTYSAGSVVSHCGAGKIRQFGRH